MSRTAIVIAAALAFAATLPAISAHAAARDRVFVASYGSDLNPCTFGSPCKTFQAAYDVVAVGGEVTAIDSAGFGGLIISHAVTITSPDGVEAGIAIAAGDTAITITAESGDVVSLRGLTIDGANVGKTGIGFVSGGLLTVEHCVVRNVTGDGLSFTSNATTAQKLAVSNSYFTNNGIDGIYIGTHSSGTITASIDRTNLYGNTNDGLEVDGTTGTGAISAAVTDSVASNSNNGFIVESNTSQSVSNLSLTHCLAEGNLFGVEATGAIAALSLAQSTVTGNGDGYFNAGLGSTIYTYGDNYIGVDNVANFGALTPANKQ